MVHSEPAAISTTLLGSDEEKQVDQSMNSTYSSTTHTTFNSMHQTLGANNVSIDHDAVLIQKFQALHQKLSHLQVHALKELVKSGQLPMKLTESINLTHMNLYSADTLDCSACVISKMTCQSFRTKDVSLHSSHPLGLVHADLIRPISIQTPYKEG